jgi:cytosine/adenosine deaminase-related metal-dependent hydrolase
VRFLSADLIFPVSSAPLKEAVLVAEDDGTILDLLTAGDDLPEKANIESFRGFLCPGFVNAHCHLELSYLRGKIRRNRGLPAFITDLVSSRDAEPDEIAAAAMEADSEMVSNGIVAVGDICNDTSGIPVKVRSRIHYHSFIELFDLDSARAGDVFRKGLSIYEEFEKESLQASIVPHSPYTVSPKLFKLISDHAYTSDSVLCMHNQESSGENEMYLHGTGELLHALEKLTGLFREWKPTGFRSLASAFVHLPRCNRIQLVHNTYSQQEDIRWAHLYSLFVWWCLCPNANLYIENKLPDIPAFMNELARITVGTDSYASNDALSILNELKTLHMNFPDLKFSESIVWATRNGAEFLGIDKQFGSFEKFRKPGVNWIGNIDPEKIALTESSFVVPLF